MAQFLTNFSENALGAGVPSGWTANGDGTATGFIATDATLPEFPRSFSFGIGTTASFTFNAAGSVNNQEVLTAFIMPTLTNIVNEPSICRQQAGVASFYGGGPESDSGGVKNFASYRITAGVTAILATTTKTFAVGEVWFSRLRCSGSTISAKFWKYGTAEPVSFDSATTDTNFTSGKLGVRLSATTNIKVLFFSCGTNGDFAPYQPLHCIRRRQLLRR